MKLKTVEVNGQILAEVQDGKVVLVDDNGAETAFDAPHAAAAISRLNGEARGHREAKEALEAKLADFAGIEDPAKAIEAMKTVQNLSDKKLMDAGEVEQIRAAITSASQEKITAAEARAKAAEEALSASMIDGAFARSQFVRESLTMPPEIAQKAFADHFTIDHGKVVAKDARGNPILTMEGDPASFDDAMKRIVEGSPFRDQILKGLNHQGTGSSGGAGAVAGKTMSRAQFDALDPGAQRSAMSNGVTLTD
jgi:hypothetical protein